MPNATILSVADFYEREVLPALVARLDETFPDFAWRRDPRGWHATNQDFTHTTLGVRADRVVCHGPAPRGFLIHGHGPILWTTYVNDGRPARGRDFLEAVRTLAERAGVDADLLGRPASPAERVTGLLNQAFAVSRVELASPRGASARDYLERRGIPSERLEDSALGLMPGFDRFRMSLIAAGFREDEIERSGLLSDSRWPGRIVGAWRDKSTQVVTLWARARDEGDADRYLYLRGAPRTGAIPYGLSDLLASRSLAERAKITLVEGVMDVHVLRAHDVRSVAAIGGASTSIQLSSASRRCASERQFSRSTTTPPDVQPRSRRSTRRRAQPAPLTYGSSIPTSTAQRRTPARSSARTALAPGSRPALHRYAPSRGGRSI